MEEGIEVLTGNLFVGVLCVGFFIWFWKFTIRNILNQIIPKQKPKQTIEIEIKPKENKKDKKKEKKQQVDSKVNYNNGQKILKVKTLNQMFK